MRALVCKKLGDPLAKEADQIPLELVHDRPNPSLREREVKIQVVAASLNFADALQVQVMHFSLLLSKGHPHCSACYTLQDLTILLTRAYTKTSHLCPSSLAQRSLD